MLYLIIPPILVVLSLIGIIVFLMRKAKDVAGIREDKNAERGSGVIINKGNVSGMSVSSGNVPMVVPGKVRGKFLAILESIIRKIRSLFLKLGNVFLSWSENIRKKRMEKQSRTQEGRPENQEEIIERVRNFDLEREGEGNRKIKVETDQIFDEKIPKPMISEDITVPQIELKDRLEKILIERIAVNPKDTEAYERLGEYYFEIGNYEHAKECFKQVMKLEPKNNNVRYKMRKLERLLSR